MGKLQLDESEATSKPYKIRRIERPFEAPAASAPNSVSTSLKGPLAAKFQDRVEADQESRESHYVRLRSRLLSSHGRFEVCEASEAGELTTRTQEGEPRDVLSTFDRTCGQVRHRESPHFVINQPRMSVKGQPVELSRAQVSPATLQPTFVNTDKPQHPGLASGLANFLGMVPRVPEQKVFDQQWPASMPSIV